MALIPADQLITEFTFAAQELSAMYTARHSAVESEAQAQQLLARLSAQNGLYITPHDMPEQTQTEFAARSADAQLKKLQSSQISYATQQQLQQQEQLLLKTYKSRKITFLAIDKSYKPFEAVWQNKHTGKIETVALSASTISGTISDISLEQNVVVIKPGFWQQRLNPDRKFFLAYIINPTTLQPAVQAS